jgi:hypothetical protein
MRSAHPSAWFQRSNKKSQTTEPVQSNNQPPFPFLSSSRSPAPPSSFTSLHLIRSKDARPHSSAASFRSAYSAASGSHHSILRTNTHTPELHSHPFASMVHAPLPVVSSHDSSEEEEECPVCLEPLSFSFRLPGEKPHIVPECGHALHEVCAFHLSLPSPVYGRLPHLVSRQLRRARRQRDDRSSSCSRAPVFIDGNSVLVVILLDCFISDHVLESLVFAYPSSH